MKKKIILLGVVAMLGLFSWILYISIFYSGTDEIQIYQTRESPVAQALSQTADTSQPQPAEEGRILSIPKIKVSAQIQNVGITAKGNMATPSSFQKVGWYKFGTEPGEQGSAVIAGHVNNRLSLPAVFADLNKLKVGDDIYIKNWEGKNMHFRVTHIATYDFNAQVPEIFNQKDGKFLKLITCTGTWSKEYRTHNQRLVVTAELVEGLN